MDECLLSALALGAVGRGRQQLQFRGTNLPSHSIGVLARDLATARAEQYRSVQLIKLLSSYGYMAAAKAVMGFLGVDVGLTRLPNSNLMPEQRIALQAELEKLGFFDWCRC